MHQHQSPRASLAPLLSCFYHDHDDNDDDDDGDDDDDDDDDDDHLCQCLLADLGQVEPSHFMIAQLKKLL